MNAAADASLLTRRQEMTAVSMLSLGFGLVGIDRFLISTLFPVIAVDLHLSYSDIGAITGALAVAWGISALFMGNLSDRIGRRRVLTISLIVFSVLIGASGLAAGLMSLILVRVVMGFADGAYTPVSIAATMAASAPQRRGFNIGIQQMMMPLFGLGLAHRGACRATFRHRSHLVVADCRRRCRFPVVPGDQERRSLGTFFLRIFQHE